MGTRADFYVGRGKDAEWLGSIAWDGYPAGLPDAVKFAVKEETFRAEVIKCLESRDDGTTPENGWPWPWDDSGTTDYAYAYENDRVYASCFGRPWFVASGPEPDEEEYGEKPGAVFPDMSERQNVTYGRRSGLTIIGPKP